MTASQFARFGKLTLALLNGFLVMNARAVQPLACQNLQANMGPFYRWPRANPGLVAPVALVWNFPLYTSPMSTITTAKSLQVDVPSSYGATAGFHLGLSSVPNATDERYRLTEVQFRKPAIAYTGLGQALTHVLEMVLIHKCINCDYWANVILPFQVTTDGMQRDIINPMIDGQRFPENLGGQSYIMTKAASAMDMAYAFDNATFHNFWGSAPCEGCEDKTVNVRYFMRTNTLGVGVDTFAQMSNILKNIPEQEPVQPPVVTWVMSTCKNSTSGSTKCTLKTAVNETQRLSDLQHALSQAVKNERSAKTKLDKLLKEVQQHTKSGEPANNKSISVFQDAQAEMTSLQDAATQLVTAQQNVDDAQVFADQCKTANWETEKPAASLVQTVAKKEPNNLIEMIARRRAASEDCSALGLSPVDIDTKSVVDPSASAPALVEPLAFRFMSSSEKEQTPRLQLSQMRSNFRVAVPPGSLEWPLGGVLSNSVLRGVSYVDIQVPGKHSINGRIPAAELQLVHESVNGKPAMAVAVPLEVDDSGNDNKWLTPVLAALPDKNTVRSIAGQPLGLAHKAFSKGLTGRYYRYDGTLTTAPCHQTEWFVMEEPGHISRNQLTEISAALGRNPLRNTRASAFKAKLVMLGSPHLLDEASVVAAGRSGITKQGSRLLLSRAASLRAAQKLHV